MTTPPYFDTYTTAIETYPDDNVELHIVDLTFQGSVLTANETATFNVKVTNNGPVTLQDVRLKIEGPQRHAWTHATAPRGTATSRCSTAADGSKNSRRRGC